MPTGTALPDRSTRDNHVCWVYDDATGFRERGLHFLADGLSRGQRLEYLGSGDPERLQADLVELPGLSQLIGQGDLTVRSIDEVYGVGEAVDPERQVATYAAATEDAVAHGYTGLRVLAEATALVRTPAQREAFARYEHLVDRYMLDHPFAALCAYDTSALGRDAVSEIACLHPKVNAGATSFQWYATDHADSAITGEIDISSWEVFDATAARMIDLARRRSVTIDCRDLTFIDHRGLLILDERARQAEAQITLWTDSGIVGRVIHLLELRSLQSEAMV
jgi:anti-anti-sigma regulatory factor